MPLLGEKTRRARRKAPCFGLMEIGDCQQSAYFSAVFLCKGGFFMNIQMNFDEQCLKFILRNNLSEKIRPYLSLGEVLQWIANHPEVLDNHNGGALWTGSREVGIVLELDRQGDTYCITVANIVIDNTDT